MKIDEHTKIYGIVGYPLGHTFSPIMHNSAFAHLHLPAVYLTFETREVEGALIGMKALGIKGMSVTIPHKSAVVPLLDKIDGLAETIGAVNTIVNHDGVLTGYNTDATGALRALEERIEIDGKTCVIIGAGGAARAIGFILKQHGMHVTITNRSVERGKELADSLKGAFVRLEEISKVDMDVLIQTTPVGMSPEVNDCVVHREAFKEGTVVMDVVYNPPETMFLRQAKRRGCKTIRGLRMFVYQGAEQLKLWTGLDAPLEVMEEALTRHLRELNERDYAEVGDRFSGKDPRL